MLKIYISHPISSDTADGKANNCLRARRVGEFLQKEFPHIHWYVPGADTEEFVSRAHRRGYLSFEQILIIDCEIIDDCDAVLQLDYRNGESSNGCAVEQLHALLREIPIVGSTEDEDELKHAVEYLLEQIKYRKDK